MKVSPVHKVVKFNEKHGSLIFVYASKEEYAAIMFDVMKSRLAEGYYYYDLDKAHAEGIVLRNNPKQAVPFMDGRQSHEYEEFTREPLFTVGNSP